MLRSLILVASGAAALVTAMPAAADPPSWAPAHGRRAKESRMYDERGRYYEPRRLSRSDRIWRGRDGRYYCKRDNGTTGLVIGLAAGALLGREIDGGRDRTTGTIVGAAVGGLLGREIDRGEVRCR